MASYKKGASRRPRRFNLEERDERPATAGDSPATAPDFLIRLVGIERLKTMSNRIVLQHWHD